MLFENTMLCYVIPSKPRSRFMALSFLLTVISSCVIQNQILRDKIYCRSSFVFANVIYFVFKVPIPDKSLFEQHGVTILTNSNKKRD